MPPYYLINSRIYYYKRGIVELKSIVMGRRCARGLITGYTHPGSNCLDIVNRDMPGGSDRNPPVSNNPLSHEHTVVSA